MKYVFLAYHDEEQWNAMPARERQAIENACQENEQDLRQSGRLFAVEDLQSSRAAITVRIVNGKLSLITGPFAETQGRPIRLFFIDAMDLNDAIQVASKMPQARRGPIEVRPVMELNQP